VHADDQERNHVAMSDADSSLIYVPLPLGGARGGREAWRSTGPLPNPLPKGEGENTAELCHLLLPIIRTLFHIRIGALHPTLGPVQLDKAKTFIDSMRVLCR
jgi:hypothetical protein